jgi:opacity protein-like surface antigen
MQRLKKLLGLALMAVFLLSAVASTAAFGEVVLVLNNKKEQTEGLKFKGENKTTTTFTRLGGFGTTKCPELATEGEQEGKGLLGTFHLHWKGCTSNVGGTCTGLGDKPGFILALGTFHLVYDKLAPELGLGILFLLEHVHFTCEKTLIGTVLLLVKGEVLCLLTPINVKTIKITVTCQGEKGDPKETVYWNEAGKEVKMGTEALLGSENEGAFAMSAQEGAGESTLSEEAEFMA